MLVNVDSRFITCIKFKFDDGYKPREYIWLDEKETTAFFDALSINKRDAISFVVDKLKLYGHFSYPRYIVEIAVNDVLGLDNNLLTSKPRVIRYA